MPTNFSNLEPNSRRARIDVDPVKARYKTLRAGWTPRVLTVGLVLVPHPNAKRECCIVRGKPRARKWEVIYDTGWARVVETESGNDVTTRSLKDRRKLVEECSEICEVLQQHFAPLIGEVEHRVGRETSRTFSPMCVCVGGATECCEGQSQSRKWRTIWLSVERKNLREDMVYSTNCTH